MIVIGLIRCKITINLSKMQGNNIKKYVFYYKLQKKQSGKVLK